MSEESTVRVVARAVALNSGRYFENCPAHLRDLYQREAENIVSVLNETQIRRAGCRAEQLRVIASEVRQWIKENPESPYISVFGRSKQMFEAWLECLDDTSRLVQMVDGKRHVLLGEPETIKCELYPTPPPDSHGEVDNGF